ncbi:LLM class flavin-dependent oxidoreductase [Streptomyces sp. NPDC058001]|uniref:LLM class flavin-dependent oxidoreductase n=1 Tax=Streptomyces sp. NPDC058001 TaxID=3346300 RepID=UPI0036EA0BF1
MASDADARSSAAPDAASQVTPDGRAARRPLSIGVLLALQAPAGGALTPAEAFSAVPALARELEEWGFDSLFFTEHHGSLINEVPSPFVLAAAAAATTERIRVGSAVALPAFYHPLRLAEDVSTLDNLSRGRVTVGVGMGYRDEEFARFGIDPRWKVSHLVESVRILRRLFAGEEFDFDGRVHRLSAARIAPLPVRREVPVWMGAQKRPGLTRAGEMGLTLPLSGAPLPIAVKQRAIYDDALAGAGHDPTSVEYPVVRECFCAATDEEAWSVAAPYLETLFADYSGHMKLPSVGRDGAYRADADEGALKADTLREFGRDRMLIGSPETLAAEFARHGATLPCDHYVLRMHFPGMPLDIARASMRRFAHEVMPALRKGFAA